MSLIISACMDGGRRHLSIQNDSKDPKMVLTKANVASSRQSGIRLACLPKSSHAKLIALSFSGLSLMTLMRDL